MLNKINFEKMLTIMLAVSIAIFGGYNVMAQNSGQYINNTGGTYKAGNNGFSTDGKLRKGGIIRMKGGEVDSNDYDGAFVGTKPLGHADSFRIEGTVIWAKNADQKVQPRYYTNLGVAIPMEATTGDWKRTFGTSAPPTTTCNEGDEPFPTGTSYYVSGDFKRYANTLRAEALTDAQAIKFRDANSDWVNLPTGHGISTGANAKLPIIEHLCYSDFWYDGNPNEQVALGSIVKGSVEQPMLSTSATVIEDNYYSFLHQWNSGGLMLGSYTQVKVFKQETNTNDYRTLTIANGPLGIGIAAPLSILMACTYTRDCDDDTTTIDTVEVGDCKDPDWVAAHPDIVCDPCVTCDPCDTCEPCIEPALMAGANVVIEITGGISYDGEGTDAVIPFCFYAGDPTCSPVPTNDEPTRVIYRDGAKGIYPAYYGILEIGSDVSKDITLLGNVFIKGKRPYALDHNATIDVVTGYRGSTPLHISFTDVCAEPDYATCGEVVGWIYRTASTPGQSYRYHNQLTTIALDDIPYKDNATTEEWFGLLSLPGVKVGNDPLSKAIENPDPTQYGYVNRVWEVNFGTFAKSGETPAIYKMQLGARVDEVDAVLLANWKTMRGYEAYDSDEYPLPLVGVGQNPFADPETTPTTGTIASCGNLFTIKQDAEILLTDNNDPTTADADDLSDSSQIIIGNIPTIIKSVRNGRWSCPDTWGGVTPQKDDSVFVRHLVYTGIFDSTRNALAGTAGQLLGQKQWSVNEHDLPGVQYGTDIILAKSVTIVEESILTAVGKNGKKINDLGTAALIIGNHETKGTNTTADTSKGDNQVMDFNKVLQFGVIYSNNKAGGKDNTPLFGNTWTALYPSNITIGGLHVMGDITAGRFGTAIYTTTTEFVPVINPHQLESDASVVNEGIIEIGK